MGVEAARIYVDHGLTGTNRDRLGLREALAACREGATLVVTKLDRLGRSLPDARAIADELTATIGIQLAEGGARIQTIMAVLGHRTPNISIIYASLSDPTFKQQYQDALDRQLGSDVTSLAQRPKPFVSTGSTPKRCLGCRPTSSRPSSNSATACAPLRRARASATSC